MGMSAEFAVPAEQLCDRSGMMLTKLLSEVLRRIPQ